MPKKTLALILVIVLTLIAVVPASAITWGTPDGEAHPYVGLLVFDDANGPAWRCTGTLIAPKVVLTAGHCTYGAVAARVWFDSDLTQNAEYPFGGKTSIEGTPIPHPGYATGGFPNTYDVGVVLLQKPAKVSGMGVLAPAHTLDTYLNQKGKQDVSLTVVGYGVQSEVPDYQADRIRFQAHPRITNLSSALTDGYNLQASNNNGNWQGGTCFGDSGGPTFLNDSNVIVSVTSFGLNQNCVGADFSYRVDIEDARSFLGQYVSLP